MSTGLSSSDPRSAHHNADIVSGDSGLSRWFGGRAAAVLPSLGTTSDKTGTASQSEASGRQSRRWLLALAPVWVLAGLWRTGPAVFDSLFSEDALFLEQARGGVGVWEPYMGYVLFLPRLLAYAVAAFPLQAAPLVASLLAASVMAGCAALVFVSSERFLPAVWMRASLASYLVLIPVAGPEVLNVYTCVQWPLVAACAWVLLTGWGRQAIVGGLLAVVALSAPQAIVLTPLALVQAYRGRWAATAAFLAGLAVQWGFVLAGGHAGNPEWDWPRFVETFLVRVVGGFILGDIGNALTWVILGPAVHLTVMLAAMLGGIGILSWAAQREPRRLLPAFAMLGLAGTTFLFCAVARNATLSPPQWSLVGVELGGSRYYVIPVFLLASTVALLLHHISETRPTALRAATQVVVTLALVTCLTSYGTPALGRDGATWTDELQAAEAECSTGLEVVTLQTAPKARWGVQVPCHDLRGAA